MCKTSLRQLYRLIAAGLLMLISVTLASAAKINSDNQTELPFPGYHALESGWPSCDKWRLDWPGDESSAQGIQGITKESGLALPPIRKPTWSYDAGSPIHSLSLSTVSWAAVLGTSWDGLKVLSEDGHTDWTALAEHEGVEGAVALDGSLVVSVAMDDGKIRAYDRRGRLQWTYDTRHGLVTNIEADRWWIGVSADGNTTAAVFDDGYVVALDRTGRVLWEVDFTVEQPFTPFTCDPDPEGRGMWSIECIQSADLSLDGGTIVVGTWDSDTDTAVVFAIDRSGKVRWQHWGVRAQSLKTSWDGQVTVLVAGAIYFLDNQGNLIRRVPDPPGCGQGFSDFMVQKIAMSRNAERIYAALVNKLFMFDRLGHVLWEVTVPEYLGWGDWVVTDTTGAYAAVGTVGRASVSLYDSLGRRLWYWKGAGWIMGLAMSSNASQVVAATCCGASTGLMWDRASSPDPIYGDFIAHPVSGYVPVDVAFTNLSVGSINNVTWDFGNGGHSSAVEPTHTYSVSGTYTVSLTLTGTGGPVTVIKPGLITVMTAVSQSLPFQGVLELPANGYWAATDDPEFDLGAEPGGSLTIEAWVKWDHLNPGMNVIVQKMGEYELYLEWDPSQPDYLCEGFMVYFGEDRRRMGVRSCAPRLLEPGWHHVVGQYRQVGETEQMFITLLNDGGWQAQMGGKGALIPVFNGTAPLVVGRNFPGSIEELRISSEARYGGRYRVPYWPFVCDRNTRALWHFDEPSGNLTHFDDCGTDNRLHILTPRLYLPLLLARS